jgi:hypothetical protein
MTVRVSKSKLWKAIRAQCVECFGGALLAVKDCSSPKCSLFPYRMGKADIGATVAAQESPESSVDSPEVPLKPTFWKKT